MLKFQLTEGNVFSLSKLTKRTECSYVIYIVSSGIDMVVMWIQWLNKPTTCSPLESFKPLFSRNFATVVGMVLLQLGVNAWANGWWQKAAPITARYKIHTHTHTHQRHFPTAQFNFKCWHIARKLSCRQAQTGKGRKMKNVTRSSNMRLPFPTVQESTTKTIHISRQL